MPIKKYTLVFYFVSWIIAACAQQDSIPLLRPEVLGQQDIQHPPGLMNEKVKIISGSRFPVEAGDLPFSVYVITKEEIRRNGYETLVDALKMAPGIRVSQPGSAMEGETFLMRGLLGNSYTKILINDIPVKPAFLASMPIGAQLPVREAERIEVIYGAGAALYGADASSGVINIITRQSEKPVFMQADLSIGGGQYSSTGVMFGGKLGRDKNIIRYFFYGSNVLQEQRKIFYDEDYNYNPLNYPILYGGDTSFVFLRNYAGTAEKPLLTNTPHLSRRLGAQVSFRAMTFSVEVMQRRDHSSLGLNPLAVSYRNPLTYTGETIQRYNLNFFKNKLNKNRKTDITFLRYGLDARSSTLHVMNDLATNFRQASQTAANQVNPDSAAYFQPQIFDRVYGEYLEGLRYAFANSLEIRVEHVRSYRLFDRLSLTLGGNVSLAGGIPFTGFLSRPVEEGAGAYFQGDSLVNNDLFTIEPKLTAGFAASSFQQLFYNGNKVKLVAGLNYTVADYGYDQSEGALLPRIAGLWNVTENVNLRSSWGKSLRTPNVFYRDNSFLVTSTDEVVLQRESPVLTSEITRSWESGVRVKASDGIAMDFTWFVSETSNLISYGRDLQEVPDSSYFSRIGYRNSAGSSIRFSGGQLFIRFGFGGAQKKWMDAQYGFSWTKTKLVANTFQEGDFFIPQYTGRIHQLSVQVFPLKKTTLIFDYLHLNKSGQPLRIGEEDKGYSTVDATGRYAFTDRFNVYLKIINLFNRQYAGIPATRTPDDLLYNPQSGFFLRLGMNYYLE